MPTGISDADLACRCLCLHAKKRTMTIFWQRLRDVSQKYALFSSTDIPVIFINLNLGEWKRSHNDHSHARNMDILYNT